MTVAETAEYLQEFVENKTPVFLHGAPGIGKSYTVDAVGQIMAKKRNKPYNNSLKADEKSFSLIDCRVSQLDASDLRGLPFPAANVTRWLIPNWLPTGGEGILFLDEMNLAPPSIQAACYQLIHDRRLGDYQLPEGWAVVAAGNRSIDRAAVFVMAAPLKNRFGHIHVRIPTFVESDKGKNDGWDNWAITNGVKTDIVAFLAFKQTYLFKFSTDTKDDAFPTPRSWVMASKMVKNIKDINKEWKMVACCVGEAAATEYHAFLKLKAKVSIDDILKNPKSIAKIDDVGIKYTIVSGLAEVYRADRKRMEEILAVVQYMGEEFGVFLLRTMRATRPSEFPNDLMKSKNWELLFNRYSKFIL